MTFVSTLFAVKARMRAKAFIVVALTIGIVSGCFGSRRGGGTNTTAGIGSNHDGPWSGGTTAALVEAP